MPGSARSASRITRASWTSFRVRPIPSAVAGLMFPSGTLLGCPRPATSPRSCAASSPSASRCLASLSVTRGTAGTLRLPKLYGSQRRRRCYALSLPRGGTATQGPASPFHLRFEPGAGCPASLWPAAPNAARSRCPPERTVRPTSQTDLASLPKSTPLRPGCGPPWSGSWSARDDRRVDSAGHGGAAGRRRPAGMGHGIWFPAQRSVLSNNVKRSWPLRALVQSGQCRGLVLIRGSSVVEQPAVNRQVVGSNPIPRSQQSCQTHGHAKRAALHP